MPRIPFLSINRSNAAQYAGTFKLSAYAPSMSLTGLVPGIDNVRHDVSLSSTFCEAARQHISRLIIHYGNVQELASEAMRSQAMRAPSGGLMGTIQSPNDSGKPKVFEAADYKRILTDIHTGALNRAKAEDNPSIELLLRLAVLKFQRTELLAQFASIVERCRVKLKQFEGPRQHVVRGHNLQERFAAFQFSKKIILRKVGQDLFTTAREAEKESIGRLRRSLFGGEEGSAAELFMNRLLFTEDARDDYLNAEHYVMLGNYESDPDRMETVLAMAGQFMLSLDMPGLREGEGQVEDVLSSPENAQELLGAGGIDEGSEKGKLQKNILQAWMDMLEDRKIMSYVMASYEAVPLLPQYSPYINPQQLKNALISRAELKRVEGLLKDQGKLSADALQAAVKRYSSTKPTDRAKTAGRFFFDLLKYYRDLRRFETVISAMDSVNVVTSERMRELSSINNTLYEYLIGEEQKQEEDRVVHHIILKADVRDSTTLTRTLIERGQNPASYFSLNFYDPINKLLPKYEATKVFIEGDAVILALFEHENEPGFGVARTCVLAKEMIEIVRAYNENSAKMGLPTLELGIGISYHDAAPLYLMDGNHRIMISPALNESDRLSGCHKPARKYLAGQQTPFNVYTFQAADGGDADEFLHYNVGGIRMSAAAFNKLREEILLKPAKMRMSTRWESQGVSIYSGVVPVGQGVFHPIVIREGQVPFVEGMEAKEI